MLGIRRHHWFEVVSCHWESWFWVVYFRICSYQTLFLLIPLENVTVVYGPQTRHIHSSISSWRDHSQYTLTRQILFPPGMQTITVMMAMTMRIIQTVLVTGSSANVLYWLLTYTYPLKIGIISNRTLQRTDCSRSHQ